MNFFIKKWFGIDQEKASYSQCGEDLIVDFLLSWIGVDNITYLDLGTNDPKVLNNTYFFYKKGHYGVLVEADVSLSKKIKKTRPKDKLLSMAVGVSDQTEVLFYKMSSDTLNTTQSNTVSTYEQNSEHRLSIELKVPHININVLLKKYFTDMPPVFVSLDIEGLDFELLEGWDFDKCRPVVFCVETLTYSQNKTAEKVLKIFELMKSRGYMLYADTYINSIFVNQLDWERRGS